MNELEEKVLNFVEGSFAFCPFRTEESIITEMGHARNTAYYTRMLCAEAPIELIVAAISHDIDRAVNQRNDEKWYENNQQLIKQGKEPISYDEYKRDLHPTASSEVICDYLRKEEVSQDIIKKVNFYVRRHEIGSFENENLRADVMDELNFNVEVLKAADAISFLDNNFDYFFNKYKGKGDAVITKVKWTYQRLLDIPYGDLRKEALRIANPFYIKALDRIPKNL